MAQAERGRAAGCAARVRRCTALLTCLGRPCVLTLGLSQLDPIPPCLSDVSRVEHRGTESVSVRVSLSNRALSLHPRVELNANGTPLGPECNPRGPGPAERLKICELLYS